jgi:hypothetical protein
LTIGSVMLVAATVATAGGMIGYVIGHWIGLRLLVRYGKYIRLDEPHLKVGHTAAKRARPNKPAATARQDAGVGGFRPALLPECRHLF